MRKKKNPTPAPPPAPTRKDKSGDLPQVHVDAAGKAYTKKDLKKIESATLFDNIIIGKKSAICKVYVNMSYAAEEYTRPIYGMSCYLSMLLYLFILLI